VEGSRDSRFGALGFFIVSAIGDSSGRNEQVHLNKSRVEQRHLPNLERGKASGSVEKDVPESKGMKREVCK
jgi:hypothetical protein